MPNDDLIVKPNWMLGFITMTNGQSMACSNTKIYYKLFISKYYTIYKGLGENHDK